MQRSLTTTSLLLKAGTAEPQKVLVQGCLHNTKHSFYGKKYERLFIEKVIKSEVSDAYETGEDIIVTGTERKRLEERWRYRLDSFSGRPGTTPSEEELSTAPYENRGQRVTQTVEAAEGGTDAVRSDHSQRG